VRKLSSSLKAVAACLPASAPPSSALPAGGGGSCRGGAGVLGVKRHNSRSIQQVAAYILRVVPRYVRPRRRQTAAALRGSMRLGCRRFLNRLWLADKSTHPPFSTRRIPPAGPAPRDRRVCRYGCANSVSRPLPVRSPTSKAGFIEADGWPPCRGSGRWLAHEAPRPAWLPPTPSGPPHRLAFHRRRLRYRAHMEKAPHTQKQNEPPKRSPAEIKRWREEFFLTMRDVPPERLAKIGGMIRTRPAVRPGGADQATP